MCLKCITPNSKCSHFKSKSHHYFDKCKHIILSHEDININDVDEAFFLYIIKHIKKLEYYLVKFECKLVFDDYQYYPYVTSNLSDNKKMISSKNFLMKVIDDLKI